MEINKYFEELIQKITIPQSTLSKITSATNEIKSKSIEYSNIIEDIQIYGSFKTGTELKYSNFCDFSVDLYVQFKEGKTKKPMDLKPLIIDILSGLNAELKYDDLTSSIGLIYSEIKFEIVPAYKQFEKIFIPSNKKSLQKWISIDPNNQKLIIKNLDNKSSNKFSKITRIIKYWNVVNNEVYPRYEIEKILIDLGIDLEADFFAMFCFIGSNLPSKNVNKDNIKYLSKLKKSISSISYQKNLKIEEPYRGYYVSQIDDLFNKK
ncbi:SMODS domain-containing nucleotidyltransferase [Belliella pelovolcani]|uniref:Nucleotidyltransferase n=1 Tax=Belliella pelovolcani TaxID=529505 RepID=A0A1N7Q5H9_9BACT|nr:hypothetical protein [Belliella pelovolcani]SIT18122.1 hypothetical protein SAMN05421761_1332 [Belliella pelovolcani]